MYARCLCQGPHLEMSRVVVKLIIIFNIIIDSKRNALNASSSESSSQKTPFPSILCASINDDGVNV